jgi:hypothetical protein
MRIKENSMIPLEKEDFDSDDLILVDLDELIFEIFEIEVFLI